MIRASIQRALGAVSVGLIAAVIVALLVFGGGVLRAGRADDAKDHIESTDAHVREQLVTIRATLESIQLQVQLTRELIEQTPESSRAGP